MPREVVWYQPNFYRKVLRSTVALAFDQALNTGDLHQFLKRYHPQGCLRTSEGHIVEGSEFICRELNNLIAARARLETRLRQRETVLIVVDRDSD